MRTARLAALLSVLLSWAHSIPIQGTGSDQLPALDEVTEIPGFKGAFPSRHFAGYINVNKASGRNLFYYLVYSEGDHSIDPLVVWLNGGPGCSSFDGWIYEHGPFEFTHDKAGNGVPSKVNPYSWSKAASMLYIDSPSGVGFSFSSDTSDYNVNDTRTAHDLHEFLVQFLTERHAELSSVPLFIGGESYAGIYVPMFAAQVVQGNKLRRASGLNINLVGYMVGNGVTDPVFDGNALVPYAAGKGLIDQTLHHKLVTACARNFWNASDESACGKLLDEMDQLLSKLNIYDSLDTCYHAPSEGASSSSPQKFTRGQGVELPHTSVGRAWPLRANVKVGPVKTWPQLFDGVRDAPPCIDDSIARTYLNRPEVKAAFHARSTVEWQLCTGKLNYTHDVESMLPVHAWLLKQGLTALIYSGDHDMCVPHTGSEAWTASLKLPLVEAWRPWLFDDGQVAGYVKSYQIQKSEMQASAKARHGGGDDRGKLTYATVMGAGHTVPEYKPKQSLQMLAAFLQGLPL